MSPELGRIAHEAYCNWAKVKPVWEGLNPDIQAGWIAVAKAVMEASWRAPR